VILHNTDLEETFVVEPGMRIAQLVVVELPRIELVEVDELRTASAGPAASAPRGS
jgi:dUTPase